MCIEPSGLWLIRARLRSRITFGKLVEAKTVHLRREASGERFFNHLQLRNLNCVYTQVLLVRIYIKKDGERKLA